VKIGTVFIAFLSVEAGRHDAFLDWHELDHRPENHGGIDHIFHSERFVADPGALSRRQVAVDGPFADPGQYVMTYWSTAAPDRVTQDMAVLRERLAALGRCDPIGRDFRATWRERMQLAKGYASPHHIASAEAAYLTNHRELIVTVGHYADDVGWQRWYDTEGVPALLDDRRLTAAYILMPKVDAPTEPFVHLHYVTGAEGSEPAQAVVARAYAAGPEPVPHVLFQGSYLAQHAGHPRFYG
jgi:hypothetical protein